MLNDNRHVVSAEQLLPWWLNVRPIRQIVSAMVSLRPRHLRR
jgi:hypothetical protein